MNIQELARAVASCLSGWSSAPSRHDHIAYLRHDETGAQVSLSLRSHPPAQRDRIVINGVYPSHPRYPTSAPAWIWGLEAPSITVDIHRGHRAIAADFQRRFEPTFWSAWHEAQAKMLAELVRSDSDDQLLDQLLATADGKRRTDTREHRGTVYYGDGAHAELYVSSGGVELRVGSLPGDVALEVMQVIARGLRRTEAA